MFSFVAKIVSLQFCAPQVSILGIILDVDCSNPFWSVYTAINLINEIPCMVCSQIGDHLSGVQVLFLRSAKVTSHSMTGKHRTFQVCSGYTRTLLICGHL